MDRLWSPWRYRYVTKQVESAGCIFCLMAAPEASAEHPILHRGSRCYIVLNRFPYSTGHLMVVPFEHLATLFACDEQTRHEMMDFLRISERNLRAVYNCPGLNLGVNIGECAGAGIAGHLHFHAVPRWPGDANFMSTVGETRILPEELEVTQAKLLAQPWG